MTDQGVNIIDGGVPNPTKVIDYPDLLQVPSSTLAIVNKTADFAIYNGRCILRGWSVYCNNGAALKATIYDGAADTDEPIGAICGAVDSSVSVWLGEAGVMVNNGLFVDLDAGGMNGAFYVVPLQ